MPSSTRRALLSTAATTTAASLAGCFGLFGGGSVSERPRFRRWLPSDEVDWAAPPQPELVFVRPAMLAEREGLQDPRALDVLLSVPRGLDTDRVETLTRARREGYGALAVDAEDVTDDLEGEPVREADGVAAYDTDGAVVAVGGSRYGFFVGLGTPGLSRDRVVETLVETVSAPPAPDEAELDRPDYDPALRAIGAPSFVRLGAWSDSLRAFSPDVQRVVHGWDVGENRTELRSAAVFPSEEARDRGGIEEWTSADGPPDFSPYDLSLSAEGRVVLVEGEASTADVRFLYRDPSSGRLR